ncbi:hypothetical protein [Moritella sp. F3]|uniref:hypothetical protein n=1 Tax=Moritella sp. F3 TaxID=2718882 RepID=UPI0018E1512F|nr:hypothetical protein [Moritella sp. F3]GIC75282.1 hypothetical protein FMO001_00090 [Moritella sp. F1]GIC80427.1 hypothetical protein FMO003_07080 [Moritella sp. F3]
MKYTLLTSLLALSGCSSQTHIMPNGHDGYLIVMVGDSPLVSPNKLLTDSMLSSNKMCRTLKKLPKVEYTAVTAATLLSTPQSSLQFVCV